MKSKNVLYDYLIMTVGAFLLAFAIQMFYLPQNLVTGGFSGLSIIITRYVESIFGISIPISLINLSLDIPLLIVTFFLLGFSMVIRTFYSTLAVSFFLQVCTFFPSFNNDMFISAVFGGVCAGVGIGLVISKQSTTGGTDLISMIVNNYNKHINISKIMFCIDSCIIMLGIFAFGFERGMYAIISVYICTKFIDTVIEGVNFSKVAYIITDKYDEVSDKILTDLDRGVTAINAKGMYTKQDRVMLMVVVNTKQLPILKSIAKTIDPNSFIIVSEAREALGEGFSEI